MEVPITCPCPPKAGATRHPKGDKVVLRDKLGSHESLTIRKAIALAREDADGSGERGLAAEILATLSEFYILMGVESWTFEDAEGKPLPVSKSNIRTILLESPDIDLAIEAADTLYNEAILLPLLNRASPSLPPTPTPSQEPESLTSQTTESTPQKPSKQSSTTTSPTGGTETTTLSLVGGGSSSQNSQSAA